MYDIVPDILPINVGAYPKNDLRILLSTHFGEYWRENKDLQFYNLGE